MIVGAVLGLVGAIIPELIRLYKDHRDRKHEIELLKLQIENAKILAQIRMDEAKALAEIKLDEAVYEYAKPEFTLTGFKFADALQAIAKFLNVIVRPIVTFMAMGLWYYAMTSGYQWSSWESDVLACIIVFWFGNRSLQRALGRTQ